MPPRPPLPYPRPPPSLSPRPPPNRPPRSPNGIPEEAGASEKCVSSGPIGTESRPHPDPAARGQVSGQIRGGRLVPTPVLAPPFRGGCRFETSPRWGTTRDGAGVARTGATAAPTRGRTPRRRRATTTAGPGSRRRPAGSTGKNSSFRTSPSGRPGVGSSSGTRGRRRGRRGRGAGHHRPPRGARRPRRPPRTTSPRVPRWRTAEASGSRPSHPRHPPGRPRPRRSWGGSPRAGGDAPRRRQTRSPP